MTGAAIFDNRELALLCWGGALAGGGLVFLGGMLAVAASRPEYKQVKALFNFIVAAIGFWFLGYAVYRIAKSPTDFATLSTAREFTVPLLLTLGLVPFIYVAALVFAYEMMLLRLRWKLEGSPLYRY